MRYASIVGRAAPCLALVLALAIASPAWAQSDAAPAAPAAAGPVLGPQEHWAKGQAQFGGEWIPIPKLFEQYVAERNRLRAIREQGSEVQERLNKLHYEIATIRNEAREEQAPIRRELGQARAELRQCNDIMRRSAPAKPQLIPRPAQPRRPSSSYDYGSSSSGRNSTSGWYEQTMREWQRQCEAIDRQNEQRMQQYQRAVQEYQNEQNKAKAAVPKLEATIKKCMEELGEVETQYDEKQEPTRQQSENVVENVRAHNRQVEAIETRLDAIAQALRTVPEDIRFCHGIIEFEDEFNTAPELRRVHTETQADIDRVRDKLKAECEQAGIPFAENWQHPQQKRMDAIKELLERAEAARQAAKA